MLLKNLLSIYAGTLLIPWNSGMKSGTVNKTNPIPSYPYTAGLVSKMRDLCEQTEKGLDAFRSA